MPKFLLLPRDDGTGFLALSPTEMQAAIAKYVAWSEGLRASGAMQLGEKLRDGEGRVVTRGGDGLVVTDGPFCEAREMIGGVWIIDVADYAAAVAAVQDCPHLQFGSIEIRQVQELTG
jgi:hypothetical protein